MRQVDLGIIHSHPCTQLYHEETKGGIVEVTSLLNVMQRSEPGAHFLTQSSSSTVPTAFTLGLWVLTQLSCSPTQVEARGGSRAGRGGGPSTQEQLQ